MPSIEPRLRTKEWFKIMTQCHQLFWRIPQFSRLGVAPCEKPICKQIVAQWNIVPSGENMWLSSSGRACLCTKRGIWLNAVTLVESPNYVSCFTVNGVKPESLAANKKLFFYTTTWTQRQESGCFMQENPQVAFCSWLNEWIRGHVPHFLFCSLACRYKRSDALYSAQSWQLLLQVRGAKFSPFIYQCKTVQFTIRASYLSFWWKMYSKAGTKFPFILLPLSLCCSFGGELIFLFCWKNAQKKICSFHAMGVKTSLIVSKQRWCWESAGGGRKGCRCDWASNKDNKTTPSAE